MAKINVKFGYPTSLEEQELLSQRAIENDCSIERALCFEFACTLDSLGKKKGQENFFDLIFLVITERQVTSPSVSFKTYLENGYKLPMIVLESEHLRVGDAERLFISNQYVDQLGKIYQTEFDYEYVGFERVML